MIRYLAYIGPKEIKRVDLGGNNWLAFPRGQAVDVSGMPSEMAKDLLRSGLFKLRQESKVDKPTAKPELYIDVGIPFTDRWGPGESPKLEGELLPPRPICGCGFVAKSPAGLKQHQLYCIRPAVKWNLGCGKDIKKGFVNIDCRELDGVDVVADVSDLRGLGKADYILAQDIIEHFPQAKIPEVLQGWIDHLVPGGTLEIRCPDVLHAAKVLSCDGYIEMLYGSQDYPENFHVAGFTLDTMRELLKDMGLTIQESENRPDGNLWIKAVK